MATFDIDYFKRVNDEWGHEIGDRVLRRIGQLLTSESRDIDVVARFGGEEFVVLLPACDESDAKQLADRVRVALAEQDVSELPCVRMSAGIASSVMSDSIDTLLQRADSALYRAKRGGRDQAVVFDVDERASARRLTHT